MLVRLLATGVLAALACVLGGCAMCCSVDDYTYPTYGGKYERSDRTQGRVGSVFSDAGEAIVGSSDLPTKTTTGESTGMVPADMLFDVEPAGTN